MKNIPTEMHQKNNTKDKRILNDKKSMVEMFTSNLHETSSQFPL